MIWCVFLTWDPDIHWVARGTLFSEGFNQGRIVALVAISGARFPVLNGVAS